MSTQKSNVEVTGELLAEALRPYFKGKNATARFNNAVSDAIGAIAHLVTVRDNVKKGKLGATVMTERASINKQPGTAPRTL